MMMIGLFAVNTICHINIPDKELRGGVVGNNWERSNKG